MKILITLLRGVNMTGHNSIKMARLTDLFMKLGYKDAETYIQTGNVVFTSKNDSATREIALKIKKGIQKEFNYDITAIIRSIPELEKVIADNPFTGELEFDPAKLAVVFLDNEPGADQLGRVMNVSSPPDKFMIIGREIYIYCPNGFGKSKLYTNFFESKMKVTGTARNWKTINSLLKIAEKKQF